MTNIFNNKKSINNTSSIEQDDITANSRLTIPRLTTTERNQLNPILGNIIFNTTLGEYEAYENGQWERIVTSTGGSGTFVTIANDEVITGKKQFRDLTLFGDAKTPDSLVHLYALNPTLKIESQAGGLSQLLMNGNDENIINMGFNADIRSKTGEGNIDIRNNGDLSYFARFDATNKLVSIGNNNPTVPKVRLMVFSGGTVNHSFGLPKMDNTGETDYLNTATTSDYNGTLWYNGNTHELRTIINGTPYDIHHANTNDITHLNTSDASSQLVGKDDNIILKNKTFDKLQIQTGLGNPAHSEGLIFYDNTEKCLAFYNENSNITTQLSQENHIRVYNNTGSLITDGSIVYISGTEGVENRPTIALARSDQLATSRVLGFVTADIANSSFGYVTNFGLINNINTTGFTAGDILYLSDTVAGAFQNTPVNQTSYNIEVGYIVRVDAVNGRILCMINADLNLGSGQANELVFKAKKDSAGTLTKGQLVYLSGYSSNFARIELADNTNSNHPTIGVVLSTTITNSTEGIVLTHGQLKDFNTSAWNISDILYLSTNGNFTNIRPTTGIVQEVGIVIRSNVNNGIIEIIQNGENSLPNIPLNNIWIGNANSQPVATLNNTVNVTLSDIQTISGSKTFSNNVNTTASYLINNFGTLTESTLTLRNGLNIHSIECVGTLASDKISWKNNSGVECMYMNSVDCILNQNHGFNITDITKSYKINGVDKILNTSIHSSIINSSLETLGTQTQNLNLGSGLQYNINNIKVIDSSTLGDGIVSCKLNTIQPANQLVNLPESNLAIRGVTGSDAKLFLHRNSNENIVLESRINGFYIRDEQNTTDRIKINSSGLDILTGNLLIGGVSKITSNSIDSSITTATGLTSLGTLTSLQVDNINLNGNTISSTGDLIISSNISSSLNISDGTTPTLQLTRGANNTKLEMSNSTDFDIDIDSTNYLRLNSSGLNLPSGGVYAISGVTVLNGRNTGWSAPTATQSKASFGNGASTTQLEQALSAVINALISQGIFGI